MSPCSMHRPVEVAARRSPASRRGMPAMLLVGIALAIGCSDGSRSSSPPDATAGWPMFGGSLARTFFNASETGITRDTVAQLIPRWRFPTGAIVTAQPVLADVERSGEGRVRLLYVTSWDGNLYALRAADGSLAWSFRLKTHPGADYGYAASATVAELDGRQIVFAAANMTVYALDAATGDLVWSFDAGDGCTTCDRRDERNQVESSPAVFDGVVYFGMDVNEIRSGKGGLYAVDGRRGTLVWYFDPETAATCRPLADDAVRRFDGYHTATDLGLPDDFFATRPGCDFDRSAHGCGGIWMTVAIDPERRLLYADSANCDAFAQGAPGTPGVMPPYGEAVFSLTLDGDPAWVWQPRLVDDRDLDFGATPNLFEAEIGGTTREVVGVGGKDGTYYVLDRDGVNELTGRIEPYWQTNVVQGGGQGGLIGSAAIGEGRVVFSTAPGEDVFEPESPMVHALAMRDGAVQWQIPDTMASFAAASLVPGVVFTSGVLGQLFAWDSDSGAPLASFSVGGPLSGPPTILDGNLYVGAGSGARSGPPEFVGSISSWVSAPINAFCIAGSDGCPAEGRCNDANPCTRDALSGADCTHAPEADGTSCRIGANTGACSAGACVLGPHDCDDANACTRDFQTPASCRYESAPAGTACTTRGRAGTCRDGSCFVQVGSE